MGTSFLDDMEQAHIKMTGQTDNKHLDMEQAHIKLSWFVEQQDNSSAFGPPKAL
jgi:hypothetical protein